MKGHIRERSPGHWAIVIDVRDPATGNRKRRWHSFVGTKRKAQVECAKLIAAVGKGDYVEPSKTTVADFVRARISQWEASGEISARTAQRYRQLLENQTTPHIGTKVLRKLRPLDIEAWHTALRDTVAARTIGHAHRVLSKALKDAAKNDIVTRNVCKDQPAPKVKDDERAIVRDVPALVAKLKDWRHGTLAMVALFTGLRLGEVLALRWNRLWPLASGSSRRSPRPVDATLRCPTFWSMCCESTARRSLSYGYNLAPGSCRTTPCCLPPSTVSHWRRIWSRCCGAASPAVSASRRSRSTV